MSPSRVARLAIPAALLAALALASGASAAPVPISYPAPKLPKPKPGEQLLRLRYGPVTVNPGTNLILINRRTDRVPKPNVDGFITKIVPNMTFRNGRVPRTDIMHLHHGVWINNDALPGEQGLFFASGEEKTIFTMPAGYGYTVRGTDRWSLNYMIHNYTAAKYQVYLDYATYFIPRSSPLGQRTKPLFPIWNDVEAGKAYPVFDVFRGSGTNGRYTYPNQAVDPYGGGRQRNLWRAPRDLTLVATAGHLHPGGLWDDLEVVRPGATPAAHRAGTAGPIPGAVPNSVRIFRSKAVYFDPHGPISWDMAMTGTPPNWRVHLKKGDLLRISATYDTRRSDWFESMGIMVAFASWTAPGVDPFRSAVPQNGKPTHGQLPENKHYGGARLFGVPDARRLPNGRAPGNVVDIKNYQYTYGGWGEPGRAGYPPTIRQGQSLRFVNLDAPSNPFSQFMVPHTVTGCSAPCNRETGISYPLANGRPGLDSAQLALGPVGFTAAANRVTWSTPSNLPPGTYTYYCRMHPFMRGAFRIVRG